jgi:hypothetical protein
MTIDCRITLCDTSDAFVWCCLVCVLTRLSWDFFLFGSAR